MDRDKNYYTVFIQLFNKIIPRQLSFGKYPLRCNVIVLYAGIVFNSCRTTINKMILRLADGYLIKFE